MLNVFRKNLIAIFLLASALFMAGCELDTLDQPEPERLVTVNLTGLQPASQLKSTASTAESLVNQVVFYGVDATGAFVNKYPIPISGVPAASHTLTISKRITTLYAVANPTTAMENANPSKTDLENMTVDFSNGKPVSPFLMSGSGDISNSSESNSSVSIALVRSVAKIEINGKKRFKVTEVKVENTPDKGYVLQRNTLTVPGDAVSRTYTTTDTIIYVAENTSGNTKLTVKGSFDNKTATQIITLNLDIERNKHYSISISPGSAGDPQYGVSVAEWSDATVNQSETVQHPYKNGIKILAIGNSYSHGAMVYLYDLLTQAGVKASGIKLMNAYVGGMALHTHWYSLIDNEQTDPLYNLYSQGTVQTVCYQPQTINANGSVSWVYNGQSLMSLEDLIKLEDWDLITLQQSSNLSGNPIYSFWNGTGITSASTYDPYLSYLLEFVNDNKRNQKCKLAWHMTWAYTTNGPFSGWYTGGQAGMYDAICSTVRTEIVPRLKPGGSDFDFIIPAGIAIQNARAASPNGFGDTLNASDGSHVNPMGSYIAGVTWVKAITGSNLANLTMPYTAANNTYGGPQSINATDIGKVINAVNAAYAAISTAPYVNP